MNYLSLTLLITSLTLLPGCWEGSRNCSSCTESSESMGCATCPGEEMFPPATGPSYEAEMNQAESPELSDEDMLMEENIEMGK